VWIGGGIKDDVMSFSGDQQSKFPSSHWIDGIVEEGALRNKDVNLPQLFPITCIIIDFTRNLLLKYGGAR
jgi:hypothetical protein